MKAVLPTGIESGQLKPVLAETWPLKHLAKAQESFMKKHYVGNIVVSIG
jgi:NADPH:quinone reductase-like Zn-dependent oxidoreductase